ncbi:ribonuclease HIII [Lactococcus kimchii]|uniref:ribonuclease HIII n=1 Tax=Lactococcus sp. S-13 TaxID=2507158 RepID=UPI001022F02D|nr:ribonuclease HIII [Lactococcus sp. S-13]RZI49405.1 ribonuclease HIII [Lactococcus sp. S-13]
MNIVLKLNATELKKLCAKYSSYQLTSKNPYISFFAKVGKTSISVYHSGKVVFQGSDAEKLASDFGYIAQKVPKQQTNLIGTDEVGNGSYFGGLIVTASFIDEKDLDFLKNIGVADSKKLTDEKICQIAPLLMEKIPHIALVVEPTKYNEVIESGYNAVSIKVALHNQAIFLLEKQLVALPDNVVIDAFTTEANYQKYVMKEKNHPLSKVTLLTKAEDQFLAVAVSSIISRFLFLENLKKLSQESGFILPSGAGSLSDKTASQIIKVHGVDALRSLAKLHFANTEKALKIAQK